MSLSRPDSLTYKAAGVDIDAGNTLVERMKPIAAKTHRQGVLSGLGGFGALFELPLHRFKQPVLVSSTDGVGTKLHLAHCLHQHHTIGIDLVAMCVNDILVQGAEPLFFLDYFATGCLDVPMATEVIQGIAQGCKEAGLALIGGETAEMPGLYHNQDYDLAGFAVGIVEKDRVLDGQKVQVGDALIGIASSGVHANGFSLIRKILSLHQINLQMPFEGTTLGEALLCPTRIYVKPVLSLLEKIDIHALAHITGGGLLENIPRVLPAFTRACLYGEKWERPALFDWIQKTGNIPEIEMYRTFNCGVGMVLCVSERNIPVVLEVLHECGQTAWHIGHVESYNEQKPKVIINENLHL